MGDDSLMNREIYWIWLQQCWGYARKTDKFDEAFTDAKAVFDATDEERRAVFASAFSSEMNRKDLSKAEEIYAFCKEHRIHVVTPESEFYPKKLLSIANYPLVLYVRGDVTSLNSKLSIAVIGSRTCSAYGEESAEKIVSVLAENKVVIVSGGALGIDSVAHKAAMENGSKTVLVMGCGHGCGYLPENSELRKKVAQNGALITEYPPYYAVTQGSFPDRNRIISGMSDGVVIVEAAERSGTLNTKNHALKQGRKIFVLPGDVKSGNFDGSNQLITEGAIPVFGGEQILSEYGIKIVKAKEHKEKTDAPFEGIDVDGESSQKRKRTIRISNKKDEEEPVRKNEEEKYKEKIKNPPEGISKNAEMVYNVMSGGAVELDEITRKSALGVSVVLASLSELEIFGAVSKTGPNTYGIN